MVACAEERFDHLFRKHFKHYMFGFVGNAKEWKELNPL